MYLRRLLLLLQSWYSHSLTPLDESILRWQVLPMDINWQGQMESSRYLRFMELGRLDLMARIGLLRLMRKQRWVNRVIAINMRFIQPLRFLQRYELVTRLLCWDNRWVYFEQCFKYRNKTVAVGQIKIRFYGRCYDNIAPGYILELLGHDSSSPTMPVAIHYWTKVN